MGAIQKKRSSAILEAMHGDYVVFETSGCTHNQTESYGNLNFHEGSYLQTLIIALVLLPDGSC